mgnify:CR=1 FL=1
MNRLPREREVTPEVPLTVWEDPSGKRQLDRLAQHQLAQRRIKHSVVLSSYNRPRFIAEAIASLKAQTYSHFQCIVADDASTIETLTAIDDAIAHDPRFVVLSKPPEDGPRTNGADPPSC